MRPDSTHCCASLPVLRGALFNCLGRRRLHPRELWKVRARASNIVRTRVWATRRQQRSRNRCAKPRSLHMLNAQATPNRLPFGHVATDAQCDQTTATPRLPRLTHTRGCMVMIDVIDRPNKVVALMIGVATTICVPSRRPMHPFRSSRSRHIPPSRPGPRTPTRPSNADSVAAHEGRSGPAD